MIYFVCYNCAVRVGPYTIVTLLLALASVGNHTEVWAAPSRAKKATTVKRWQTLAAPPALPTPTQSGDVTSAGIKIHYAEFGQGQPVVLLHGGMGSGDQMALQVAGLVASYRVIVIDSRGQGRSEPTDQGMHYQIGRAHV